MQRLHFSRDCRAGLAGGGGEQHYRNDALSVPLLIVGALSVVAAAAVVVLGHRGLGADFPGDLSLHRVAHLPRLGMAHLPRDAVAVLLGHGEGDLDGVAVGDGDAVAHLVRDGLGGGHAVLDDLVVAHLPRPGDGHRVALAVLVLLALGPVAVAGRPLVVAAAGVAVRLDAGLGDDVLALLLVVGLGDGVALLDGVGGAVGGGHVLGDGMALLHGAVAALLVGPVLGDVLGVALLVSHRVALLVGDGMADLVGDGVVRLLAVLVAVAAVDAAAGGGAGQGEEEEGCAVLLHLCVVSLLFLRLVLQVFCEVLKSTAVCLCVPFLPLLLAVSLPTLLDGRR